ncbi:Hsp70 family protein [Parabacteroides sp. PF5-9]|uniref:Hsp70 family protein n=1 Tax=Parabacteroides sp. PF5-9 TaxID=1742404 RepID=UPI002472F8EC|nr:Hsp70 family protein [Parabacteroides sp. PF5-9]MDH6357371.1 molecular chaperone DnaK [Parabacteroides sp. PF5-9]
MARIKIDYGIDLGTTNSAISRMERGEVRIIKSLDKQKDTTPSCIAFNPKGTIFVGDKAYDSYRSNSLKSLSNKTPLNAYVEFKRTMGTDKKYHSSYLNKEFSSEELSAEILKRLKEYIQDETIKAAIITVPAAFKNNQIDATRRAGKLAGFDHIEVLQEPVAASMAYGLDSSKKEGFWLVFDFGGGTFDAALLKVEDGIMKVIDTEGDNYLGGKNLDYAVVDQLIIPHIQQKFSIDGMLSDDHKKAEFRSALKFFAEEIKNNLSFNASHNIYVDPGDCGEDDNGEEIEIDLTVVQDDLKRIFTPIFQKAIDCSLALLNRNNLKGSSLDSLILVGGPTLSPVLREMLDKQLCKPDTSVDPMTVVSRGAALYASTIDISESIKEESRDRTKIQLEIGHEASSVEPEEFVTLKILADKTEGTIPDKVFAEISRGDGAWSSGKVEINTLGEVVDVQLAENKMNVFEVTLYDDKGNVLECEPASFSIIQGSKIGSATLPYNIGIEILQKVTSKVVFVTVKGLEKNQSLPATGTINGLKTQKQIRPGMDTDFIKIPIYQGEHNSEGTRAIYNEHVYDIIISGADLPALLPESADVDLTFSLDKSQKMTVQAYFPYLDHTAEISVPTDTVQSVDTKWLESELDKAGKSIKALKQEGEADTNKLQKLEAELGQITQSFENSKNDVDAKQEVLTNLRKLLKEIDQLTETSEWPKMEKQLKDEFHKLEEANQKFGNEKTSQAVAELEAQVEEVFAKKDTKLGGLLLEEINQCFMQLTLIFQLIGLVKYLNDDFNKIQWRDPNKARALLNQAIQQIGEKPTVEELQPIIMAIYQLLPPDFTQPQGGITDFNNDILTL